MIDDVTPELLVSVVDELLLVQRGKELGYSMSDDQFKNIVDSIRKENKIETDEAFQAALKQENMTMVDLRRNLEHQMMITRVTQSEVLGKLSVTDEELHSYYDAHMKDFTTSPVVTMREVLVPIPAGGSEDETRRRIEAIRARAMAGESFEKLAADLSEAPSRSNGGLIGPLSLEDLAPEIRRVVEPLSVGEITPALRTATGFQLLKLDSATPKETKPFDQARESIGEKVYEGKQASETKKYLEKLRSQSIIQWKNPELQKAYDEGLQRVNARPAAPPSQ
jgi:parvulin-like peptidyl-prolyl isomerase